VLPGHVRTGDGRRFGADEVVVAAGSWTGRLLASAGIEVPIQPRRGHVLVAERTAAGIVRTGAMGAAYAMVAHSSNAGLHVVPLVTATRSGTVLIGASRERTGFENTVDTDTLRALCAGAVSLYPALRSCRVIRSWVGFRPWTPDGYPYVGRLCPGLSVAAGHEGEGITYAPLTGTVIAELLLDAIPVPEAWDPARRGSGVPTATD
jgi:glycine/D-amino acid oxidase-like deaminating enzyme